MSTIHPPARRPSGMFGLTIVLLGQAVSILASSMTGFALSVWVFQQTSSATSLGIMQTAFTLPYLLIIPLAGVMVDRYNRKLMMAVSDLAAGLGTLAILFLLTTGNLEIWHFYLVNAIIGLGNAFQWPAYSAAITTMVPKEQYGRANGMMSFVQAGPGVVAPLLAGALLPLIGLNGILWIDVITFVLAIGVLMLVHIPPPRQTEEGRQSRGSLLQEAGFGFKYIFQRPSLWGYVIMLFVANLFLGFPNSVHVPMILLRTDNSSIILGAAETAGAISWTVGSLLMSAWGGPRRRIHGALLGWIGYCVFGNVIFGLGTSLQVWIPAILLAGLGSNIGIATSQAILQSKVAPDVQGRVFSARRMLTWFPDTFTPILGGLLADRIMEPAMLGQGWLAKTFGWMVGNTPGSGMALIMIVFGILTILAMLSGYIVPQIRNIEDLLPDHDQLADAVQDPSNQALPG
ncbi:MAG TPA: MFS transporter [Anaerolineaceae bacterium]|nr:MFS transporter [Anaerolineaceae bacterium]HOH20866.1 MFS transporter [Anaerolineaceae bacterium]HOU44504.1 MFS transporter [Anaerolineaceae bacterium]HQF46134.1 MFS transporter [Anaerolineaceae bacterium]HQH35938.1 MFS transporter [Anaerolineaceae bacterium]